MSRTDDYGLSDGDRERNDRSDSVFDLAAELPSRLGLSREAARAEIERFRGIAEYETRKIFGQRSVLKQPVDIGPPQEGKDKRSEPIKPRAKWRTPKEQTDSGNESARGPKQAIGGQAQPSPLQTELDLHDK